MADLISRLLIIFRLHTWHINMQTDFFCPRAGHLSEQRSHGFESGGRRPDPYVLVLVRLNGVVLQIIIHEMIEAPVLVKQVLMMLWIYHVAPGGGLVVWCRDQNLLAQVEIPFVAVKPRQIVVGDSGVENAVGMELCSRLYAREHFILYFETAISMERCCSPVGLLALCNPLHYFGHHQCAIAK